ncbi:MAG: hypothetical protein HOV79_29065 [Hamadaea sp.]|nr:hypothetical protein [Hamadaea sp.]
MSTKQKVLLIGLGVLLVVLFVVAVGVGGRRGEGDPERPGGIVDWLGRFGAEKSVVNPATVTGDCERQGATFEFTGSCDLRVADPGGMKTLILRSGKEFTVSAPAPGGADFTVEDTVQPSPAPSPGGLPVAEAKIAVDQAVTVELSCPGIATTCRVTVAAE